MKLLYIVIFVIFINGLAHLTDSLRKIYYFFKDIIIYLKKRKLSDKELKERAGMIAKKIIELANSRQVDQLIFNIDDRKKLASELSKQTTETMDIYYRDYYKEVFFLRGEFLKRKYRDEKLDMLYKHPTNFIGLREVAMGLLSLSTKLK
jgi:hypothetical protein